MKMMKETPTTNDIILVLFWSAFWSVIKGKKTKKVSKKNERKIVTHSKWTRMKLDWIRLL